MKPISPLGRCRKTQVVLPEDDIDLNSPVSINNDSFQMQQVQQKRSVSVVDLIPTFKAKTNLTILERMKQRENAYKHKWKNNQEKYKQQKEEKDAENLTFKP